MLILLVNVVIINSKHVWTLESNFVQTEILELNFHVAIHVGSISFKKKKKNLVEAGYIYANNSSSIITVPLPKIGYMPQYEKCVP